MADPIYDQNIEKLVTSSQLNADGEIEEVVTVVPLEAWEKEEKEVALIQAQIETLRGKVANETDSAGDLERLLQLKQFLGK